MKKADVIHYYGGQSAAARALGLARQTVNAWGDVIPELQARRYADLTEGIERNGVVLRFDPSMYELPRKAS